jgi:glycosyltransferase involved in cell wall biosynthesis
MKICFYTTGDINYIATMKRALGMSNSLVDLGWEVFIIALDTEENRKRISLEATLARPYYFSSSCSIGEIRQKHRLLNRISPDVVWVCSLGIRNFVYSRKWHILVEHSELGSGIPDNEGFKKLKTQFFEFISIYYTGLITASLYLENYFNNKIRKFNKKTPVHYSPYAYNKEVINLPDVIYPELKDKYNDNIIFVYMGTLTKNYGLFSMLNAAKVLSETHRNFKLLFLGRGRHFDEAKNFIVENNLGINIELLGYVEEKDLSSFFKLADAFISPLNDTVQDWARCPSKVYMYLPYKKPILTCKIGEPKEIFGMDGHYFDYNDPQTLANLMKGVVNNKTFQTTIDINKHSWKTRAIDFDMWFKREYSYD